MNMTILGEIIIFRYCIYILDMGKLCPAGPDDEDEYNTPDYSDTPKRTTEQKEEKEPKKKKKN